MRVFVGQIYIQPGINYPFSNIFQKWVGEELTKLIKPSELFLKKYAEDFNVIFRLSAKSEINKAEIRGPTVFKKDKDIEFTIFLPHNGKPANKHDDCKQTLEIFFDCVVKVLESISIDSSEINKHIVDLVDKVISDETMFTST